MALILHSHHKQDKKGNTMKHFITHILAAVALLAVTAPAAAQQVEYQTTPVFQYGEKATFRLYYNLGFVWIHAGNVDFTAHL